jgi:hypothetical protein
MLDHADQDSSHDGKALRNAQYASLTSRAVTDNSRTLVDDIYQRAVHYEVQHGLRKRKRVGKERAFIHALEGFVADLLKAVGRKEQAAGWVRRPVTPRSFSKEAVSSRDFHALRVGLVALGLELAAYELAGAVQPRSLIWTVRSESSLIRDQG